MTGLRTGAKARRARRFAAFLCALCAFEVFAYLPAKAGAPDLKARIDDSLAATARFLLKQQFPDGAWRSETYGVFKDGPSLTPLILSALFFLPQGGPEVRTAYRKGVSYLTGMVGEDRRIRAEPPGLMFPVLTAGMTCRVVALEEKTPVNVRANKAWLAYLRGRQLTAALGWKPADVEFGGWGFSLAVPRKPASGHVRGLFFESNMVATIFGIAALRSAKVPAADPAYRDALVFVKRCQNFPDPPQKADPRFDDGGFCFIPDDPVQNKAGITGKDRSGRTRFHSYGSMTADGLRALIRCGLPPDHPRVIAARKWLEQNFRAESVPGVYERDREVLRDSTYYYYAWSVAHAFSALNMREIETKSGKVNWAKALAEELLRRQRPDGSWVNTYTDAREDDPLVATPWAAAALAICRHTLTGESKDLTRIFDFRF
jgi:squalene-hopene/tetraprenyl-beta-curcumene cyclase